MKYVLLLIVLCTCVYIGIEVKKYFADRLKFYDSMLTFCEYTSNQISFYGTTKDKIISGYSDKYLLNVLNGKFDKLLGDDENKKIQQFLDSIGHFDVGKEIENIEFYKIYFNTQKQKCQVDNDKKGGLSLKLSILIGILLCILLF